MNAKQKIQEEMYRVICQDGIVEVDSLEDARDIVAAEWNATGEADSSGFINPWIEDANGNMISYHPSANEIDAYK